VCYISDHVPPECSSPTHSLVALLINYNTTSSVLGTDTSSGVLRNATSGVLHNTSSYNNTASGVLHTITISGALLPVYYFRCTAFFSDHVSPVPAAVFPVRELASLCRSCDTLLMVFGVHGPGHVHTDLNDLDPDFYIGTYRVSRVCGCERLVE
jgi:hypothetical protein